MHYQRERSPSESLFWPVVWAVGLHVIMFAMLFVSFAFAPELPPAKPVVQATLYKLQSQSQATTQTNQKIAGETKKTTAPVYETEQLEQKKAEQEKVAAKAAEQKKAQEAQKAEAAKKAEADKKAAEQKKLADVAKKQAADEAAKKKAAEDAKKKAAEEAKKKAAAEAAKKKAADDAKKKATEAAQRKAVEDKKAAALAELLSEDVGRQQAIADTVGDQVAGSLDDLIVMLVSQQWRRPPSARNGMSVEVLIEMLPDGTITNASVTRSSGDSPFDNSAVQAVRNVGRIAEMQQLDRATFDRLYRQRRAVFKPEDLGL
ncbi:MAG: protein TolA [Gammaproteobacteria bacterium HGW-Gammaproteobacteria-13]|uniref:cell envelope integrity protein TolA n=1 Tax=unclassified Pseudomonas TaxID=196821 RepID=UPI000CB2D48A|nr:MULTISPECIES: cell envelope integrity protein TolA [unclassified Pseudomonas]MDF3196913.1 cell envelope integrity protein TolA [Pseudomonas sp. 1928-m]MDP2745379.1 cell envelope integrity protein TolA [Pseudomonas sp.]PKM26176.1 MAG: protein TolA [Gammaproteobacteria bacterium HGW-Gammaproteobacteria-13]